MAAYNLVLNRGDNFVRTFTFKDSNDTPINLTGYSASLIFSDTSGGTVLATFSTTSGHIVNGGTTGILTINISPTDVSTLTNAGFYILELVDISGKVLTAVDGSVFIRERDKDNIEYLIPFLRLRLGDTVETTYRYLDEWLKLSLILSVKKLQRYWKDKYIIDTNTGIISRGTATFDSDEPNVIQSKDEDIIVLMAVIIVLEGSLEQHSWDAVSWRDDEISYSNLESFRTKDSALNRLINELNDLILPPRKRLARTKKQGLYGYHTNPSEYNTRY